MRGVAVFLFGLAEADDLDLGRGLLVAEFDDFDTLVEAILEGLLGSVLALSLVLLDCRVDTCPTALGMDTSRRQVIDDVQRDQILLELPASDGLLAQRTSLVDPRPVLNANIAKSMSI